jgi:hypothetical protein
MGYGGQDMILVKMQMPQRKNKRGIFMTVFANRFLSSSSRMPQNLSKYFERSLFEILENT